MIFGTLNVESTQEAPLTEDDLRLMTILSEQINIAIRRAQLYADRAESLRREQHINEFAHAINSTLELPVILEVVTRLSVELIGADAGTISLMSEDGTQMIDVFSFNDNVTLEKLPEKGNGLTWLVYETGKPIILDEYSQHPNSRPEWTARGIHALLGVPLRIGGKSLGTLALVKRTIGKNFTQRDLSLIEAIAQEIAIAIQNARLFEALQNELSEHKQTQEKLKDLVRELEAKNAELERFTYSVSHDLKSPIVTIGGFLGFLEKDILNRNYERTQHTLLRIREATKKMERLLDELLELSRVGRIINPPVDIPFGELVSETLELVDGQLREAQVEVKVDSDLPVVHVDRVRMVEVLQNLITNAVKFMGAQNSPIIHIGMSVSDGERDFFVKDNGIGIAPEYHERVFGLFNKLDPYSDGTGIGLALVKRIIEVHGGKIWVESDLGKGTTFFFTLEK
jgi:signal transduction histidine kinase